MTNAQETNVKQEPLSEQAFLDTLINLCDDLAWGRPASEDRLFALTKEGAGPKNYVRLAEAFGRCWSRWKAGSTTAHSSLRI